MNTGWLLIKSVLEFGLMRSAIIVLGLVVFCAAELAAFSRLNITNLLTPAAIGETEHDLEG
jgi:heavy metal efflux system protein